jgi:heterodisulfide reductase subunit C
MSVIDLTSMAKSQDNLREEINQRLAKLQDEISDYCFQCAKCTAGCEAHKLLELEPHKVVALLKRGLIDELINSDIIWTCMTCLKCFERCPQKVAPVEILHLLKNMAVASGKEIPGGYTSMLQSILSTGFIQEVQRVSTRDNKIKKREDLGLPPLKKVNTSNLPLSKLAIEKI